MGNWVKNGTRQGGIHTHSTIESQAYKYRGRVSHSLVAVNDS